MRADGDAPCSAWGVHCRSCQTRIVVGEIGQLLAVDGVDRQTRRPAPGCRRCGRPARASSNAPKWMLTPGVSPPPRTNSRAWSSPIRLRSGPAFSCPFSAGEQGLADLGRRQPSATDGLEQVVVGGDGQRLQHRLQRHLGQRLARARQGLFQRRLAQLLELVALGSADVAADGRARPARDRQTSASRPGPRAWSPRTISTTSPFWSWVRIGFSSPLILTPTAVSPTSVWTA